MRKCLRSYSIFKLRILQEIKSIRVLMGGLWGISYTLFLAARYTAFAQLMPVNPVESFILLTGNWSDMTFLLIGFLFVISDVPFRERLIYFTIHRSGKRQWIVGGLLYLLFAAFMYTVLMLVGGGIVCLLRGGVLENNWSQMMNYLAGVRPTRAIEVYSINICSFDVIKYLKPYEAVFHASLMFMLYCFLMAVIMFAVNLYVWFPYGSFVGIMFHFFNLMIVKDGLMALVEYSPIGNSMLDFHVGRDSISFLFSYLYYCIFLAAMIIVTFVIGDRCDYGGWNGE